MRRKRIIGALYGIFLEPALNVIVDWKYRFEHGYLQYCRNGCGECYKWLGYCRSIEHGTPYKIFRRKVRKA